MMQQKSLHKTRLRFYFPAFSRYAIAMALSVFILLSQSPLVHANAQNKELVSKLWQINNNDKFLNEIKRTLLEGEDSLIAGLEKSEADKITAIVNDNFTAIRTEIINFMINKGRTSVLSRAYKWLETPLGKKVSKMELVSNSFYSDPEAGIPQKKPDLSAERAGLLSKFERIAYPIANTFLSKTMEHFIYLQNNTRPPNKRLSDKELAQGSKLIGVKMGSLTSQKLPHIFHKYYSDLSLEEVTVYLNFLDSEGGKGYNELFLDAYINAVSSTREKALLQLSKLFEDELSILSPYSKVKLDSNKQRELMAMLVQRHGKDVIIRSMVEACGGQMTIMFKGDTKEVYGRPNHKYVTMDTLMIDLDRCGGDIRRFYQVVQKKLRTIN